MYKGYIAPFNEYESYIEDRLIGLDPDLSMASAVKGSFKTTVLSFQSWVEVLRF